MTDEDMTPERYYDRHPDKEAQRLQRTATREFEFENTKAELQAALPDTGLVLDAGGGPGRYSVWLAEQGYSVEHCDISREQVRLAEARVQEHEVSDRVTCRRADLRDLPYDSDRFDGVVCLGGPISHIVDPAERHGALEELRRVARSGAPAIVSVMGRLAALQDSLAHVLPEEDPPHGLFEELAADGRYTQERVDAYRDGEGWAETKFFRADEFERECERAGLSVQRLVGLEGVASTLSPKLAEIDDAALAMIERVITEMRTDPVVVDISEHMLAVCEATAQDSD